MQNSQERRPLLLSWRQELIRTLRRRVGEWLLAQVANIAMLAVFAIFGFILWKSVLFFTTSDSVATSPAGQTNILRNVCSRLLEMLTTTGWHPERGDPEFGMLAMIYGSLAVTVGAMVVAIPISLATAVVLSDMVPFRVRQMIKPVMELLAAIPSVAFGFFAIKIVAPWLQETFNLPSGTNALNASLILAIMAIPTIVSVAEDALSGLGRELREASYALGATRMETVLKIMIPAAHSGILTAIVLGTMRAVGETMVVWMAAGNASNLPHPWYDITAVLGSFGEPVRTMTATIAGDMGETSADSIHRSALFTVGFVLLVFTFLLNMLTEILSSRFKAGMGHVDSKSEKHGLFGTLSRIRSMRQKITYKMMTVLLLPFHGIALLIEMTVRSIVKQLGKTNHLRLRLLADKGFTLLGFASVGFLSAVLVIVLGSLLWQGREAFLFRATVEHRLYLKSTSTEVSRNIKNQEAQKSAYETPKELLSEFTECQKTREPVYNALLHYAWLDPEPLIKQVKQWDHATRKANADQLDLLQDKIDSQTFTEKETQLTAIDSVSKELAKLFAAMCQTENKDELTRLHQQIMETSKKKFKETSPFPMFQRMINMAEQYYASAKDADLSWRNKPTEAVPDQTYAEAFRELRNRITGADGNGALLGPENRNGIEHQPPEFRYGAPHWSMAKKYNAELQQITIWKPQPIIDGKVLPNLPQKIDRRIVFSGETFIELRGMLDYIDENLAAMMHPRWTFYYQYFFSAATAGHFLGGVGAELLGTFLVTLCAIAMALPVGVATAAYLVEMATENRATQIIRLSINTLAGVPSIVFGLFGLAIIVQYITGTPCIIAGSLTLALLVLPVVIRASEEAIRSVPRTFREASLGLGASPARCFFSVTLPSAMPGILTGTILAMSRAAGETAPLLFTCAVATGSLSLSLSENPLFQPTPVLSYSAYDVAVGDRLADMVPYNQYGLVAALILVVLFLNLAAIFLRGHIANKLRGG
ncbi:MAG: phosphate ABC transporter permease subunit PstC [Planctomycetaceae bacterium]|jgi:phosphate ABC transporter permease protein PstC/phosphate ABC transporter permease subunit PstA|nr:phosphate ABC transporter permease subunit PstC [Planctomycetaceae bacterium]